MTIGLADLKHEIREAETILLAELGQLRQIARGTKPRAADDEDQACEQEVLNLTNAVRALAGPLDRSGVCAPAAIGDAAGGAGAEA